MAIELCNSSDESSLGIMSPARISFSHDISQADTVPVEQYIRSTSPSSSIDFDFCVFRESFDIESSSADELFFDGKILPIEIKRRISSSNSPVSAEKTEYGKTEYGKTEHRKTEHGKTEYQRLPPNNMGYAIEKKPDTPLESSDEKQNSKSFWRFKRSSSLNCGSGYARTLCPLPLLSRSNSTGSSSPTPHGVRRNSSLSKEKQSSQSQRPFNGGYSYLKPPLKKGSYNNGVRVNSMLNVNTSSLFGFSSFFSNGKEKNKKK